LAQAPALQVTESICANSQFGILNLGHLILPFDLAQGGELVEPFVIWNL